MNIDRLFAAVWLVLCVVAGWLATGFVAEISYEPVGPGAFPLVLCILMAVCCLWLIARPGAATAWPARPVLARLALMIASLLAYALTFQWLGFAIATALLTAALGRLFGGSWRVCLVAGILLGGALYLVFDRVLDVTLPAGLLAPLTGDEA